MRVEIFDYCNSCHSIDTLDAELAGKWMAEKFGFLMSANAALGDCRLRIWPSNQQEAKLIGYNEFRCVLTQEGLLDLAQVILDAAARAGEIEARQGRL